MYNSDQSVLSWGLGGQVVKREAQDHSCRHYNHQRNFPLNAALASDLECFANNASVALVILPYIPPCSSVLLFSVFLN